MVSQRRYVQVLHERFNVKLFLKEFNARYDTDFKVVAEPNPPEAIIQSKNTTRWVEVTTAYLSEAHARDLNSYAVKGEKHQPRKQGMAIDLDEQFAQQFVGVVIKKLGKMSYEPFFKQHGKGYLVVSIQHPMFDQATLAAIQLVWDKADVFDQGFFKSIYIVNHVGDEHGGGYKVSLWKSNLS